MRRALLRLVNRLARRREQEIVQVGDLLARAAKRCRIQVGRDGLITYTDPTMVAWPWSPSVAASYMGETDDEFTRQLGEWYLRGSDE